MDGHEVSGDDGATAGEEFTEREWVGLPVVAALSLSLTIKALKPTLTNNESQAAQLKQFRNPKM